MISKLWEIGLALMFMGFGVIAVCFSILLMAYVVLVIMEEFFR